jgi:hypothetical protein
VSDDETLVAEIGDAVTVVTVEDTVDELRTEETNDADDSCTEELLAV